MKIITCLIILLSSISGISQTSYSGYLGKFPITLVTYSYGDGDVRAYYIYDRFDTPIIINGKLNNGELMLFEHDNTGEISATLIFSDFKENDNNIRGKWMNKDKTKSYKISLEKDFDISYGDSVEWENKELIQSNSTKNHYFKTLVTKEKGDFYARITGVKIYEKKTDRLIQTIKLDCQLFGIDNVSIGDYNFDGIEDFSVFEASYAGPNTSSIFILKDPKSEKYIVSDYQGTSLEFDSTSKLIYEHNQCCAGRSHMNATYKVVHNKMILIGQKCLEYNDDQEDFIEIECE